MVGRLPGKSRLTPPRRCGLRKVRAGEWDSGGGAGRERVGRVGDVDVGAAAVQMDSDASAVSGPREAGGGGEAEIPGGREGVGPGLGRYA